MTYNYHTASCGTRQDGTPCPHVQVFTVDEDGEPAQMVAEFYPLPGETQCDQAEQRAIAFMERVLKVPA